jgi:energy-coupling factor transport system permease protein
VTGAPGTSAVERAHPFTPLTVTLAVVALAFLLPEPAGPAALALALVLTAPFIGDGHTLRPTLIIVLPLWILLFIVLGILGDPPFTHVGPVEVSAPGFREAVAQGSRLTAIVVASVLALRGFRASRFVDAAAARGWPFPVTYLAAATLQTLPRLRQRVLLIRDAQWARGLRLRGSIVTRAAALIPLALPLILGALADADDRAIALETRAVAAVTTPGARRTPLHPPADSALDRGLRWGAVACAAAALLWRIW